MAANGNGKSRSDAKDLISRRHPEWQEHQLRWRWLLDSLEGGERYRQAVYGHDSRGIPIRNLARHKREYPEALTEASRSRPYWGGHASESGLAPGLDAGLFGSGPSPSAQDDTYELRRSRTPVPEFMADVIEVHLSKIYQREIRRVGPPRLDMDNGGWWGNVDGAGTKIDDWMTGIVAPLILAFGFLDIAFDHPGRSDSGVRIANQADVVAAGLDRCVASHILPENMLWWRLGQNRRYQECLVLECVDPSEMYKIKSQAGRGGDSIEHYRYRHWTATESTLYSWDGDVISVTPHLYGRPPIVRVFDRRKLRCPQIGKPRYESVAEYQREYYNRDSELILSDTLQANPILSGPEDYCQSSSEVVAAINYLLPMKRSPDGGSYQGWAYVTPPKDPAESIRRNKQDIRDLKDESAALTKPAGAVGSAKGTVGQSGISKQFDNDRGNSILANIAKHLANAEREIAEHALLVLRDGKVDPDEIKSIEVVYPARFDLFSVEELAKGVVELQAILAASGSLPKTESLLIQSHIRLLLVGLGDEVYREIDDEVEAAVASKAEQSQQSLEMLIAGGGESGPEPEPEPNRESETEPEAVVVSGKKRVTRRGNVPYPD